MKINVNGHHIDITEGMRSIAEKKFNKLSKRFDSIDTINITVKVERKEQHIEAKAIYLGDSVSVSSSDNDYYAAIDQAAKKLTKSLESRKGNIDTHSRDKPVLIEDNLDEVEATDE